MKLAREQGFRSRAVFKIKEINEKDHILKPGMTVVDLGAAPGGWTQYAAAQVGARGVVIALDLLPMEPPGGHPVTVLQGDFRAQDTLDRLHETLAGRPVDLVISDMAPNISGIKAVDQPRAMYLAELATEFATTRLRPGGDFLLKVFQGQGFETLLRDLRQGFGSVATRKPRASRSRSNEYFLLARNCRQK